MTTKIVLPQCKKENIPAIGGFILARAKLDLVDISVADPDVDMAYLDALDAKLKIVEVLVQPREKTEEIKETIRLLYEAMIGLRPKLNLFEIKLNRAAEQLIKPPSDFGLTRLRKQIKYRNAEGILSLLEMLLRDIDANTDALQAKGFTTAMREEFAAAIKTITTYNNQQNLKWDERGELTLENQLVISDFWKGISELMRTGRLLYKSNPVKVKEYTFAVLKRRVGETAKPKSKPENPNTEPDVS